MMSAIEKFFFMDELYEELEESIRIAEEIQAFEEEFDDEDVAEEAEVFNLLAISSLTRKMARARRRRMTKRAQKRRQRKGIAFGINPEVVPNHHFSSVLSKYHPETVWERLEKRARLEKVAKKEERYSIAEEIDNEDAATKSIQEMSLLEIEQICISGYIPEWCIGELYSLSDIIGINMEDYAWVSFDTFEYLLLELDKTVPYISDRIEALKYELVNS